MKKILSILITFIVLSANAQDSLLNYKGVKRAASTVGLNYINLTNPSVISFPRMNADNTVSTRTVSELLSDLGAISGTASSNNIAVGSGTNTVSGSSSFTWSGSAFGVGGTMSQVSSVTTLFHNIINTTLPSSSGRAYTQWGFNNTTPTFIGWQAGANADLSNTYDFVLKNARLGGVANVFTVQDSTRRMGIGVSSPTAMFHLLAGTTTANSAPLKFTSGPPTTTPEVGAIHFSNGLWIADSSNSVRDTLATRNWARLNISGGGGGGGLTVNNPAYTGVLTTGTLGYTATNPLATFQSSVNAFNQFIIQNSNNGASASSDVVVNNDVSTNTTFYGDFGMNSSGFTGSGALNQPSYVYLTSTSSDLAIGTTTSNPIHFVVNSGATDALTIGTTGLITGGTAASATAAVSTLALRDANGNLTNVNSIEGYSTTVTAAGTTTLTVSSNYQQFFSGSTTQTVVLPVTSTLVLGQTFIIVNNSTGLVTVNSSGANNVIILAGGTSATVTCILTSGTTAASWNVLYEGQSIATGKKLTVSNSITFAGTDATVMTLPTTTQTLAGLSSSQTFTGANTFNNATVLAGAATMAVFNTTATNLSFGGAATTLTIGGTATAGGTHSYSTGITASGQTKNINFANAGAAGSTTNINFGTNASSTTITMAGNTNVYHLSGGSSAPGVAASTGAGTGPTVSASGSDLGGYLNITTGTGPATSATVVTVTFSSAFGAAPKSVVITPANAAAAALTGTNQVFVNQAGISTTVFTVTSGSVALAASTAYQFYYHIIQ